MSSNVFFASCNGSDLSLPKQLAKVRFAPKADIHITAQLVETCQANGSLALSRTDRCHVEAASAEIAARGTRWYEISGFSSGSGRCATERNNSPGGAGLESWYDFVFVFGILFGGAFFGAFWRQFRRQFLGAFRTKRDQN